MRLVRPLVVRRLTDLRYQFSEQKYGVKAKFDIVPVALPSSQTSNITPISTTLKPGVSAGNGPQVNSDAEPPTSKTVCQFLGLVSPYF